MDTRPVTPTGTPGALVTGLRAPWSIAFLGETALISQRDDALILEVLDGGGTREVGVVDGVRHGGEGGLLGLAVDAHSRLYVYSTGEGGNRVQRHALTGRPGSLGLGPAETVIGGLPSAGTHNGGRIAFGPDGMLYVTVGDAGRRAEAQDLDSLAGKILRLTPDGAVPADNPVPGSPVYSLGHRNPQGLAWSADGTLFSSEFGQNTWDELNVIVPGGNYGWPEAEGEVGDERFVDPVQQWATSAASPSGITVLGGTVFVANLRAHSGSSPTTPTGAAARAGTTTSCWRWRWRRSRERVRGRRSPQGCGWRGGGWRGATGGGRGRGRIPFPHVALPHSHG
ncbi:MAG: PQQ-dependent sugar dehydrogenase, partial [Pauljensenia sp.]